MTWLFIFILLAMTNKCKCTKTPVVLVHGILSTKEDLDEARYWFATELQREIFSIEIGNGRLDSLFQNMHWQLDALSKTIDAIDPLQGRKFHLIGFSQGGLLARAYAESTSYQRIETLMTFGTPHMGMFLYSDKHMYSPERQQHISFSNYWKDPFDMPLYLQNCTFLPVFNGEKPNTFFRLDNKVENFVMVWSPFDEIIRPMESGKYEFYAENTTDYIVPFLQSETYAQNSIGMKTLFDTHRMHFIETDCAHREYKSKKCLERHEFEILRFLIN